MNRRATLIACAVAFVAAVLVYLPTLGHGLVNYDDPELVSAANPAIGKGLLGGLPELLDPTREPQFLHAWLPLYYWSIGLDHALGGAAWIFHLHNALLHALGAAVVVLLARRLGLSLVAAAVAGAVFAVHPAATESVAWVASRKDPLSFVWMGFAALCYLEGLRTARRGWHAAGALCLAVSLTAKGTTVVLPLLLAVHALLLRPRELSRARRLTPVLPYAAAAAALTAVHLWVASREGTAGGGRAAGLGARLVAQLEVVWAYARTLLLPLPSHLSVEHGITPDAADGGAAVLGGTVVALLCLGLLLAWGRSRGAVALLLAVPLALLPFNNFLPRTSVLFAERYAYVALLPVALAAAWALEPRRGTAAARAVPALGVGLLAALTLGRLPAWESSVALWSDAAAKAPESALPKLQLAQAFEERARASGDAAALPRAEEQWRAALASARTALERMRAETGLGTHLFLTGAATGDAERLRAAIATLVEAERRLDLVGPAPGREEQLALILVNRATAHELLGETQAALRDFQSAAQAAPRNAAAWNGLARAYLRAGRGAEAETALARSAEVAPDEPSVVADRARVRLALGDASGAKRDLDAALAKHPDDVSLLVEAGRLDALLLRPVDAAERFRRALVLRPDDPEVRQGLAAALVEQAQSYASRDDADAAQRAAEEAAEVLPGSSAPEQLLGIVARRSGDLERATLHFRRAHELQPEGPRIREQLASVLAERALEALDAGRGGTAVLLLEEALAVRPEAIATGAARLESGVAGWPPRAADATNEEILARDAALRGLALLAGGRAAEAAEELLAADAAQTSDALRVQVLRLLVRAQFLTGRPDAAVEAATRLAGTVSSLGGADAAWRGPADLASAFVERGLARRGGGDPGGAELDFDRALVLLEDARAAGMPESRAVLRVGEVHFAREDFVSAVRSFDRATALDPRDPEPWLDRAAVNRTMFLIEEDHEFLRAAERELRGAVSAAPSDPRGQVALGEVLVMQGRPADAFPLLQRAVLSDPSQAVARRLLAELVVRAGRKRLEAGEVEAAREAADRAASLDPPSPVALLFLGDVLRAGNDWQRALDRYLEAERRFPDSLDVADALAHYYLALGHSNLLARREGQAVLAFRRALAYPQSRVDLGPARERLRGIADAAERDALKAHQARDLDRAEQCLRLAADADPAPERFTGLGLFLSSRAGRDDRRLLEQAADAYTRALELDPGFLPARLNRGAVLLLLGRLDESEADFRRWAESAPPEDPDRGSVRHQLAFIERLRAELDREFPR